MPTVYNNETHGSNNESQDLLLSEFTNDWKANEDTVPSSYAEGSQWRQDTAPLTDMRDCVIEETEPPSQIPIILGANNLLCREINAQSPSKCSRYGCRDGVSVLQNCCAVGCIRMMHISCYAMICSKNSLPVLGGGQVLCTKLCYKKYMKHLTKVNNQVDQMPDLAWDKDGKLGPTDVNTSLALLMNWWTTEGNYSRFRGKNNRGIKKR